MGSPFYPLSEQIKDTAIAFGLWWAEWPIASTVKVRSCRHGNGTSCPALLPRWRRCITD